MTALYYAVLCVLCSIMYDFFTQCILHTYLSSSNR